MTASVRTLLVWCPDWPVVAAEIVEGVSSHGPVAVLQAGRVIACSPAARGQGVVPGLRKREAQSRCPQLVVVDHDLGREARAFEPVVAVVEQVAAGVQVLRPGACALAVRGPARYFGDEQRAAAQVVEQIAQECAVEAQVGIADGVFSAELAACSGQIVAPGASSRFLAELDVRVLQRPELTHLLRRLGVRTLGDFAALPAGDVLARFGFDAALAHRFASGGDDRPLAVRRPPPQLAVTQDYEEALERVDVAAFAARALAARLHQRLSAHGVACTRLGIEVLTADGQERHRTWRHDGLLTAAAITDRVRWQLESWLAPAPGSATHRPATRHTSQPGPSAGIVRLRLVPDGVIAQLSQQPGLWGETGARHERATRVLARVQSLLGPDGAVTATLSGGRGLQDQVRLIPVGDAPVALPQAPWPGRLPAPAPATVLVRPTSADVQDAQGQSVTVSARLALSGAPARLTIGDDSPVEITGWAGPWPVDERWWASAEAHRAARFQVSLADGRALLLTRSRGVWQLAAVYD